MMNREIEQTRSAIDRPPTFGEVFALSQEDFLPEDLIETLDSIVIGDNEVEDFVSYMEELSLPVLESGQFDEFTCSLASLISRSNGFGYKILIEFSMLLEKQAKKYYADRGLDAKLAVSTLRQTIYDVDRERRDTLNGSDYV